MEIFGISIKATIKPNLRVLILPSMLLAILVILTTIVFKNGITRISAQLKNLEDSKKTENILQEKVAVLRRIEGVVLNQADITALAIPEKNPGVLMLSQISQKAESSGLTVVDKKTSSIPKPIAGMSSMKLIVILEGELSTMVNLAKDIKELAPLSTINVVRVNKERKILSMEVDMAVYWGDFPTLLPPLTEPIKTLSQNEEMMVSDLGKLEKPAFVELEASAPVARENPFR